MKRVSGVVVMEENMVMVKKASMERTPFRGDHAIFRLNNHNYLHGVLDRLGYIVVSPEYQSLDFMNAHTLVGRKPHSDSESINL